MFARCPVCRLKTPASCQPSNNNFGRRPVTPVHLTNGTSQIAWVTDRSLISKGAEPQSAWKLYGSCGADCSRFSAAPNEDTRAHVNPVLNITPCAGLFRRVTWSPAYLLRSLFVSKVTLPKLGTGAT